MTDVTKDVITKAKGLIQQTVGGNNDEWGRILNDTIGLIDHALGGTAAKAISGNLMLTRADAQNTGYHFTGSLSATAMITFPAYYGLVVIRNDTNHTLKCGMIGGVFATIPAAQTQAFWSDGTDFINLSNVQGNDDTMYPGKPWRLPSYTVSGLPMIINVEAGAQAFASNARNPGEADGNGTGCVVCRNKNGIWLAVWSGLPPTT